MREIQDMTLQRIQGLSRVDARFAERETAFHAYLSDLGRRQAHYPIGIRATLFPTRSPVFVERLYKNPDVIPVYEQFELAYGERVYDLMLPGDQGQCRPILGGVRYRGGFEHYPVVQELHRDGFVEVTAVYFAQGAQDDGVVDPENVVTVALNAILTAHRVRTVAGAPDAEYVLEVEVSRLGIPGTLAKFGGGPGQVIGPYQPVDLKLPRQVVGASDEFQDVLRWLATDLVNSAGADLGADAFNVAIPSRLL